ncbi:MAG: hypothetical protein OHK0012_24510 [Synechococcales cyanobacterium]
MGQAGLNAGDGFIHLDHDGPLDPQCSFIIEFGSYPGLKANSLLNGYLELITAAEGASSRVVCMAVTTKAGVTAKGKW